MEVRIYHYLCVSEGGKKYLKQVPVDNKTQTMQRMANAITFATNLFSRHKSSYIEVENLLPKIEIDPSCYQFAVVGQIYSEFQIEIKEPVVAVGPGKTEIKSETLPVKRVATILPSVIITEKMMLKTIVAEFYTSNEPFDKIAAQVLSKFSITPKQ